MLSRPRRQEVGYILLVASIQKIDACLSTRVVAPAKAYRCRYRSAPDAADSPGTSLYPQRQREILQQQAAGSHG